MPTSKGTILVIEDDYMIRESLQEFLTLEGYTVKVAQHGQLALDQVKTAVTPPDLIIVDLFMPVMDGQSFIEAFKSRFPRLSSTPIILMSAAGKNSQSLPRNYDPEMIHHKPLDLTRLLNSIEDALAD